MKLKIMKVIIKYQDIRENKYHELNHVNTDRNVKKRNVITYNDTCIQVMQTKIAPTLWCQFRGQARKSAGWMPWH